MKSSTVKPKIGQAVMSVIVRPNGKAEVTFTWVQPNRGTDFDDIVGLSPTYEDVTFPVSKVRLGDKDAGETQAIMFVPTGREDFLVSGDYAGLIKLDPDYDYGPEILCIASKTEFDSVVAALLAKKEAMRATPVTSASAGKKPKPVNPSWNTGKKEEDEDPTIYKVEVVRGGQKVIVAGTLKEIVAELTMTLKKDPNEALHATSTTWWKKGGDNRYSLFLIPSKIPAPPAMLLASAIGKKGRASA